MASQSALYSEKHATAAGLALETLGVTSWDKAVIRPLQSKIGAGADGWFGPKSVKKWKAWKRDQRVPLIPITDTVYHGTVIVGGEAVPVPKGVMLVNFLEPNGIPAQSEDTAPRTKEVTQFVLHRGCQTKRKKENYAQATERVLDGKGCSTTFTMDVDGTIYQHFDPAIRRGRHASKHNTRSDALDIAGPFEQKRARIIGQYPLTLKMAIGRKNDGVPPMKRKYGTVKCWSMTPAQIDALVKFVPWYCEMRGIPVTACSDWRTFRVGGLGSKDPVTKVQGIVAHCQIAGPGSRIDGILPLHHLLRAETDIDWRSGVNFLTF